MAGMKGYLMTGLVVLVVLFIVMNVDALREMIGLPPKA